MNRVATADGRIITAAQHAAELLHPSNTGRVLTAVIIPTFTAPGQVPSPPPLAGPAISPQPPVVVGQGERGHGSLPAQAGLVAPTIEPDPKAAPPSSRA